MSRIVFDLMWTRRGWTLRCRQRGIMDAKTLGGPKSWALYQARAIMRHEAREGMRVQLVVRARDGRILFEHTYPRSSDPRRRRG